MRSYYLNVLPQGMANCATLCQILVARVIQNICDQFLQVYIIYYMDDILLSHKNEGVLLVTYG